jgi:hypothetical protein
VTVFFDAQGGQGIADLFQFEVPDHRLDLLHVRSL